MAHFAEIDKNNIVTRVLVVPNEEEHRGQEYLADDCGLGGTWLQTSYNTVANKHILGGQPFRGSFAGVGSYYDPIEDVFIPPIPFTHTPSGRKINWVWNKEIFSWDVESVD